MTTAKETMMENACIVANGEIRTCTKLQVLTIGIGDPRSCEELSGVFEHQENGETMVFTKEAPQGIVYPEGSEAVVRVLGDNVLIDGKYDLYCPPANKLAKLLSNPCNLQEVCTEKQLADLKPVLDAAKEVKPSIAPAEPGRRVIVITDKLINTIGSDGFDEKGAFILERDEWDTNPDSQLTKLYSGDIFLVTDEIAAKGYRIGKEEFNLTHTLD